MPVFRPPTHEEPIRTNVRPLCYFRLTWANSVIRSGTTFGPVRSPSQEQLEAAGKEGVDWFIGGHVYQISDATEAMLEDAGYGPYITPS